jgi:thermitase
MLNRSVALLFLLSALALSGCTRQASPADPSLTDPPLELTTARPDYVLQVPVSPGTTRAEVEAKHGAPVLVFAPQAGYAVLGLSAAQAGKLNSPPERNRGAFTGGMSATMGGSRGMWLGGDFQTWSGGSRGMWLGGQYGLVPENTLNFQRIRLQQAQAKAPNLGVGVKVAVIDTGVDLEHPAFAASLAPQAEWRDFYDADLLPDEEGVMGVGGYGHGTAVAGIVLQIAPNATILPLRVLGPDGSGDVLNVAQAIDWAVAKGARIINLSLGSGERSKVVQDAIARAKSRNVMVVSSAGNDNLPAITYPASDAAGKGGEYGLSVGSVSTSGVKSSFSNYSSSLEMVAPGENVYTPGPDSTLVSWSGTSMAAPMVTGGLALALGERVDVPLKDVTMKMAENAFDVYHDGMNQAYKDKLGKKGLLDLEKFLNSVL